MYNDEEHGYRHGDKVYHQAPSGPLADSEAVYSIEGYAVDFMVATAEEDCPNCGEKHGSTDVVARLMFRDDKPLIISLDPATAIRLGNELISFGTLLVFGPPSIDPSTLPPGLLEALGLDPDSLDMPDDEEADDDGED